MSWNNITPAWSIDTKTWYVYAHLNPITKAPFYIGKGTGTRAHDRNGRNKAWHFYQNCLKELGLIFEVHILHTCESELDALKLERSEIARAIETGHMLVNDRKMLPKSTPDKEYENLTLDGVIHFLRTARRFRKMTQKQLAKKSGLPQTTISKIEVGSISPTIATLIKIFDGLDIELAVKERKLT